MRKQLALIIPIVLAMIGMFAIVGLNSVNAQNMNTPEIKYDRCGTNATMGGNMTSGNATSGKYGRPIEYNDSVTFFFVSNLMFFTSAPFRKIFTFVILVSVILITNFAYV